MLWRATSLHLNYLGLLNVTLVLTGSSRGGSDACESGPIRVEGILVVFLGHLVHICMALAAPLVVLRGHESVGSVHEVDGVVRSVVGARVKVTLEPRVSVQWHAQVERAASLDVSVVEVGRT